MPNFGGIETVVKVKEMFREYNASKKHDSPTLLRPLIGYFSATEYNVMKEFLKPDEKAEVYLEKPLPKQELFSLIKLLT